MNGPPVVLLHGFPDDVRAWDDGRPASPRRATASSCPTCAATGPTRFLDRGAPRMAQQAAIGPGPARLHGRAGLERREPRRLRLGRPRRLHRRRAVARARAGARHRRRLQHAEHAGAAAPGSAEAGAPLLVPVVLQHRARPRGARAATGARSAGCCGGLWSPSWRFDDATFDRTARGASTTRTSSTVVIHSYRHRHGNAPGDPRFDAIERRLAQRPRIDVPTVSCTAPTTASAARRSRRAHLAPFPAGHRAARGAGAGHFLPREQPGAVVERALSLLARTRWASAMWLVLALVAALCQVLRNTVMKRLGHSLDEYINVWGRFTFLLPFAGAASCSGRACRSSSRASTSRACPSRSARPSRPWRSPRRSSSPRSRWSPRSGR